MLNRTSLKYLNNKATSSERRFQKVVQSKEKPFVTMASILDLLRNKFKSFSLNNIVLNSGIDAPDPSTLNFCLLFSHLILTFSETLHSELVVLLCKYCKVVRFNIVLVNSFTIVFFFNYNEDKLPMRLKSSSSSV